MTSRLDSSQDCTMTDDSALGDKSQEDWNRTVEVNEDRGGSTTEEVDSSDHHDEEDKRETKADRKKRSRRRPRSRSPDISIRSRSRTRRRQRRSSSTDYSSVFSRSSRSSITELRNSPPPGSEAAEVLWKLTIHRRQYKYDAESRAIKDQSYKKDSPFQFEYYTEEPQTQKAAQTAARPDKPVIEVIQHVFDSRYTLGDKARKVGLNELGQLRISRDLGLEILIRSKALLQALKSLISYYPEYPEESFSRTMSIPYPYRILMHHFDGIDSYSAEANEQASSSEDQSETAAAHMQILKSFLADAYHAKIAPTIKSLDNPEPKIEFEMLWWLFRPGEDAYYQAIEDVYACVISSIQYFGKELSNQRPETADSCSISCWCLDTDGDRIARVQVVNSINRYSDQRSITSLPICPTSIWDQHDGGKRRAKITARNGIHLEALRNGSMHVHYDGQNTADGRHYRGNMVIDHLRGRSDEHSRLGPSPMFGIVDDGWEKFEPYDHIYLRGVDSKDEKPIPFEPMPPAYPEGYPPPPPGAIPVAQTNPFSPPPPRRVDPQPMRRSQVEPSYTYPEYNRSEYYDERYRDSYAPPRRRRVRRPDYQSKAAYGTSELTPHQIFLLFPFAPAFALSTKQWMMVSLGKVKKLGPSEESIENLVLVDQTALQTIKALSLRHDSKTHAWSADFIEGKGSGQIILLHGPPGVGKTYTVESISAWLQRPLLALTVADIGTVETQIERELMRWFNYSEAWNAVLLVDEADIFLEQRKTRDLARNGLVSAFLRRMEYFRGLLFLTTNRVGQIDDAFMSRIHVAIGYEKLPPAARQNIWRGFFKKVEKERAGKIIVGPSAQKYVLEDADVQAIELNGRDIRNALQTAIALAEFETLEGLPQGEGKIVIVEESHFRRVLQMSEKFHKYITSIRREDEAKRAVQRGDRNDYTEVAALVDRRLKQ